MDRENKAIKMFNVVIAWLDCACDAASSGRPDIIAGACSVGVRRLESIQAYLGGGPVPGWYEEYSIMEAMEVPEGWPLSAPAAAMSDHVVIK